MPTPISLHIFALLFFAFVYMIIATKDASDILLGNDAGAEKRRSAEIR